MKIAIVHDDLMRRGGAEQVALAMHKCFPEAPIYTLCYQPELTYPEFKNAEIITSPYQYIAKTESIMKNLFYPFGFWAMRQLSIKNFDRVILSSTYASKYANFAKGIDVINYCHNPFRLAWYPESYTFYSNRTGLPKRILDFIIRDLQKIDLKFSKRATKTIINSEVVRRRVKEIYGLEADHKINPPVNLSKFTKGKDPREDFLVVSRLEPYKKVDLIIDCFNKNGVSLTIVGNGSQKKELKKIARPNIQFKEGLSSKDLAHEYAKARALIFPQEEDFGITPVEANASGTPVIAFGKGGICETMVPFKAESNEKWTSVFFDQQSTESLQKAIEKFEQIESDVDREFITDNAKRFSTEKFIKELKAYVSY